jgi:hypothetical protein
VCAFLLDGECAAPEPDRAPAREDGALPGHCQHRWQLFDLDEKNASGIAFIAAIL